MPDRLEKVMSLPDRAIPMKKDYASFKEWLVSNLSSKIKTSSKAPLKNLAVTNLRN